MTRRSAATTRSGRWAGVALVAGGLVAGLLVPPAGAHDDVPEDVLVLRFESGESLLSGTAVVDTSGEGNSGIVRTGSGGALTLRTRADGTHYARLPAPCSTEPCPRAHVRVPDDSSLDPGDDPLRWSVKLRMRPDQASQGSNLLQKGLWGDPGGQWKLEVDGADARPSCVVSGYRDGTYRRVFVRSSVSVATGLWTRVTCRRTDGGVAISVNGVPTGFAPMAPVRLDSDAPVTVGAKWVDRPDGDQFSGDLDSVVVQRL